jgi:uncharacterized membrane protein
MKTDIKLISLFLIILISAITYLYFNKDIMMESDNITENENYEPEEEMSEENNINKIMIFHNGNGPMCLEALDFLETIDYPNEQFINTQDNFSYELSSLIAQFGQSEGISNSFGYYPIIFINDRAFSGFNDSIKNAILEEIAQ